MKFRVYENIVSTDALKDSIDGVLSENGFSCIDKNIIIEILVKNGYVIRMPNGECRVSEIGASVGIADDSQLLIPREIQKEIITKCVRNNCMSYEEPKYSRRQYRKLAEQLPSAVIFLDGGDRFYSYSESAEKLSDILGIEVYRNAENEAGMAFNRLDIDSIENILVGKRVKYYIYSSIVPDVEFEYVNASENPEGNNRVITAVVGSRVSFEDCGETMNVILAIPRNIEVNYSNLYNVETHLIYEGLTLEKLGAGYVGINTPIGSALYGSRIGETVIVSNEDGSSRRIRVLNIE